MIILAWVSGRDLISSYSKVLNGSEVHLLV